MATTRLKSAPKPPESLDDCVKQLWKDCCARLLDSGGLFKSDLPAVKAYCEAVTRLQQAKEAADRVPMLDEKGKINPLHRYEMELSPRVRSFFRSIENTANERQRGNKKNEHGGQKGVRQSPARAGVPSNKSAPSSISWLDEARAKANDKAS